MRGKSNVSPFDGFSLEKRVGDITDAASVQEAVYGCEVVFHVAGFVNTSPFVSEKSWQVNVEGTENVIAACCENKVRRLVHTSSIVTIGYGSREQPATENSRWNFEFLKAPYYETKRAAEQRVLGATQTKQLDAVIVNPGYILGPWDMKPSSGKLLMMVSKKKIPIYPTGGISVVHVDDVVEGHLRALEKGRTGERYILAGNNLTYRELLTLMAEEAGVSPPRIPFHPLIAKPAGWIGDFFGRFWPRTFNDVNSLGVKIGSTGHYVSSQKAKQELGYQPKTARQAVADSYRWFCEHNYL